MTYLFTPPQRIQTVILAGRSLRYNFPVSLTVFKVGGAWVAVETPSQDQLNAATKVLAVSGRPSLIDDATAAELITAGIGTCVHIP